MTEEIDIKENQELESEKKNLDSELEEYEANLRKQMDTVNHLLETSSAEARLFTGLVFAYDKIMNRLLLVYRLKRGLNSSGMQTQDTETQDVEDLAKVIQKWISEKSPK